MANERRIPDAVKRTVRQRCGFGCVICGLPIYDYEHMLGFAKVRRHVAEEITLLCPTHHAEKTRGLLPLDQVQAADREPFNPGRGAKAPYALAFSGNLPPVVWMLGSTFTWEDRRTPWLWPLYIYGYRPFGFTLDEGGLLLNVNVKDSRNRPVLLIQDSVIQISSDAWDATLEGHTLTIREEARSFIVVMGFNPPNQIAVHRYRGTVAGGIVDVQGEYLNVSGGSLPTLTHISFSRCFMKANIGLLIGGKPDRLCAAMAVRT